MEIHIILHIYVIFNVFNVKRQLNIIAVINATMIFCLIFILADNIPYKISPQMYCITEIFGGVNNLFWSIIFISVLSAFTYLNLHIFIYLYNSLFQPF